MALDGAFRVMLAELASVGLDPAAVCEAARVDARALDDARVPLGLVEVTHVLERAAAMAGDPLVGLHMAERARGRGVLSYLARTQRTVGEGLDAFARFAGEAWGAPGAVSTERCVGLVFVRIRLGSATPRHVVEYLVARTAIALRRSGAHAGSVAFAHAPAGPTREYERVLRCPVRFRQPETGIALRPAELGRRLPTSSPETAEALGEALARAVAGRRTSVSARVAAAVETALVRGAPIDREALARSLGMSGKTLARRLADERRLFRDVVEEVRRVVARRLVVEGDDDLGEVAARVGFADLAAFGKAFRRWFGESASALRARRRAAGSTA